MNPEMIKKAKKMQEEMLKAQQEIEKKEFIVEKQGIKVILTGNYKVKSIEIDEVLIDPDDVELLQDVITIAINEAVDLIDEEVEKATPNLGGQFPF